MRRGRVPAAACPPRVPPAAHPAAAREMALQPHTPVRHLLRRTAGRPTAEAPQAGSRSCSDPGRQGSEAPRPLFAWGEAGSVQQNACADRGEGTLRIRHACHRFGRAARYPASIATSPHRGPLRGCRIAPGSRPTAGRGWVSDVGAATVVARSLLRFSPDRRHGVGRSPLNRTRSAEVRPPSPPRGATSYPRRRAQ